MLHDLGNRLTNGCVEDIGATASLCPLASIKLRRTGGERQAACVGDEHAVGAVLHKVLPRLYRCSVCGSMLTSRGVYYLRNLVTCRSLPQFATAPFGFDHRVDHFRPLRMVTRVLECHIYLRCGKVILAV